MISILFEETSQHFESGASGGSEGGKEEGSKRGKGRNNSELSPGEEGTGKMTGCQCFPPKYVFLAISERVKMSRVEENKGLRLRSGP